MKRLSEVGVLERTGEKDIKRKIMIVRLYEIDSKIGSVP